MADFEDETKIGSETHLRETPNLKARGDLSKLRGQSSLPPGGGLVHMTPPSRDGKVRQPANAQSKWQGLQKVMMILLVVVAVAALANYRYLADLTYSGLATIEMLQRNVDGAAQHYKDAYFINPDDINPLLMAASIHLGQRKEQLAQEEFATVLKHSKTPAFVHNQRAKILKGMGRVDEALADWSEAIRIDPNYFAAHAQRATIYQDRGKYEESLQDWDAAAKNNIDPKNSYALACKAYVLGQLRRYPEALEATNQALQITPNDEDLKRLQVVYTRETQRK